MLSCKRGRFGAGAFIKIPICLLWYLTHVQCSSDQAWKEWKEKEERKREKREEDEEEKIKYLCPKEKERRRRKGGIWILFPSFLSAFLFFFIKTYFLSSWRWCSVRVFSLSLPCWLLFFTSASGVGKSPSGFSLFSLFSSFRLSSRPRQCFLFFFYFYFLFRFLPDRQIARTDRQRKES